MRSRLSLLNSAQFVEATIYFVFVIKVMATTPSLGGERVEFGSWFDALDYDQQQQVLDFFMEEILVQDNRTLTWYDNLGMNGAYRIETVYTSPVTSR